jgi:hypothetical protein
MSRDIALAAAGLCVGAALTAALMIGRSPQAAFGETYDECVLINLKLASTRDALDFLSDSCAARFRPELDWNLLAKQAGIRTWGEVVQQTDFKALAAHKRQLAAEQYWEEIGPFVRPEFRAAAREQFLAYAKSAYRPD